MKHKRVDSWVFMGLILGGLVCSWAAPARAEEWSKTYTLTGKPDLRVDTSDANIHVSTWDQNTIESAGRIIASTLTSTCRARAG